jgi:hypothetical protein
MEYYVAEDRRSLEKCINDVANCDLYIGIFAWRYGYVPPGRCKSITELEYCHAINMGRDCLIFLRSEKAGTLKIEDIEFDAIQRLREFRNELSSRHTVSFFFGPDDLSARVSEAVHRWERDKLTVGHKATNTSNIPFQAPVPPTGFVERAYVITEIKKLLEPDTQTHDVLVVSAIQGLGGVGKTALASYLAHAPDVLNHYPDGVLWATLGQSPDLQLWLNSWIRALGDFEFQSNEPSIASSHLRSLLHNRRMLLFVDDVWQPEHGKLFIVGSTGSVIIITTRRREIADEVGARLYELDLMTDDEARQLIENRMGRPILETEQELVVRLADAVGHLPLALELIAAQAARDVRWEDMLGAIEREVARLEALETPRRRRRGETRLEACFNLSIEWIRGDRLPSMENFYFTRLIPGRYTHHRADAR